MPLDADDIGGSALPRAKIGGYSVDATDDLLRRVSWDQRQLVHEHKQLVERVAELERQATGVERQRVALEREVSELRIGADRRRELGDVAAATLEAARRAAREARETARRDAELTLKKAGRRARLAERSAGKARNASLAELEALRTLNARLRRELQDSLAAIEAVVEAQREDVEAAEPAEQLEPQVGPAA